MNCTQQQRPSQRCNSVQRVDRGLQHNKQGQEDISGDKQAKNANIVRAVTRHHWIQTDTVGRTDIALAWGTPDPRATTPCQNTSVQPPALIRWEEARQTNHSDVQGRTLDNWIKIIAIWLTTKVRKSLTLILFVQIPPYKQQLIPEPPDTTSQQIHHAQTNVLQTTQYQLIRLMERSSHQTTQHYFHSTTYRIMHANNTFFQAFKNHSYPLAPSATITALQSSMQKG